ncbi:MAG: CHAT domain-containing protein [Anaerolineae bacterium]|nr:CHAT domain-containing protein [Anaerolineae bacterium]
MFKRFSLVLLAIMLVLPSALSVAQDTPKAILQQLDQMLAQADQLFSGMQYSDAINAYDAAHDLAVKQHDNGAFSDADQTKLTSAEYRGALGAARSGFLNLEPYGEQFLPGWTLNGTDEEKLAIAQRYDVAIELLEAMPQQPRDAVWAYWGRVVVLDYLWNRSVSFGNAASIEQLQDDTYRSYTMAVKAADLARQARMNNYWNAMVWIQWHLVRFIADYTGDAPHEYRGLTRMGWYKEVVLPIAREYVHIPLYFNGNFHPYEPLAYTVLEIAIRVIYNKEDPLGMDATALMAEVLPALDIPSGYGNPIIPNAVGYLAAWKSYLDHDPVLARRALALVSPRWILTFYREPSPSNGVRAPYLEFFDVNFYAMATLVASTAPDEAYLLLHMARYQTLQDAVRLQEFFSNNGMYIGDDEVKLLLFGPGGVAPTGVPRAATFAFDDRDAYVKSQAIWENYYFAGLALNQLARYREAIPEFENFNEQVDNALYPDAMLGIADAYQGLRLYEESIEPLNRRRAYYEKLATSSTDEAAIKAAKIGIIDTILRLSIPYSILGRTEEALTSLQDAVQRATELDDLAFLAETTLRVGDISRQLQLLDKAATSYTDTIATATKVKLDRVVGRALLGLGNVQIAQANAKDARQSLTKAVTALNKAKDAQGQIEALTLLGDLDLAAAKPNAKSAETNYTKALDLATQLNDPLLRLKALFALTRAQSISSPVNALLTFYHAMSEALTIDDRETTARLYGQLGQMHQTLGHADSALDAYQNAIKTVEQTQSSFKSEALTAQFSANYAWIYADYVSLLFEQGRFDEAFNVTEQSRARAFLDQLALGPVNLLAGASSELVKQEADLRDRIDAQQHLLTEARREIPPDKTRIKAVKAELEKLESDYADLFTRMQATSPTLATFAGAQTPRLADLQAALPADTSLVSYYTTDAQTYIFVVSATDLKMVAVPVGQAQLAEQVSAFRADEINAAGLPQLSEWLVTPILDSLTTKHVMIVPHNVLHALPFAALPVGDSVLGERAVITYLPSAASLLLLNNKPTTAGTPAIFGNPTAEDMSPLPFAETEAQQVAALSNTTPLIGDAASKAALLNQASGAGVLYIAAHGTYNALNPLFSTLHLAPSDGRSGRLYAYEIYGLDLTKSTSLVVLSACETAVGTLTAGDEFTALNRAFLYAGAPSVVASLWSVDDEATALLMETFFKLRAEGKADAEALQAAQKFVREYTEGGQTPYASPYFWAAFVLTGRG